MKLANIAILLIIITSFGVGIFLYPKMPDIVASHWNYKGQVDGFISKFWGLFLMPIISLVMFLMFLVIPKIDPLRENIAKFRGYFDRFIVSIILFMFYLYTLTLLWNFGRTFSMVLFLSPAFAVLFYYVGTLLEHTKRNWFIGVRTPWTLSSDAVWDKTHKIGAFLFKACGVISLLGILFPNFAVFFVLIPVLFAALYLVAYSYFEHEKEVKLKNK